ncbi:hypothetical protein AVDCRST_MAG92-3059 [uncultured Coleofasciculus sp.]|uniref:Uncharacterized protein n=1 Tax=uncultured Coleofasciculus sp. TaxID=1267456 RepID=A0A6J4JCR4_9CYAN|nr:hypothetical protein AVDCRST_MAG92-3059 [uncultured Coleofasciculus sp.]
MRLAGNLVLIIRLFKSSEATSKVENLRSQKQRDRFFQSWASQSDQCGKHFPKLMPTLYLPNLLVNSLLYKSRNFVDKVVFLYKTKRFNCLID